MSSETKSETRDSQDYALESEEVLEKYYSSEKGLDNKEAQERLEKYGKNEITEGEEISPLKIFLSQFTDFLIIILIIAAIFSYSIGFIPGQEPHTIDTGLILIILLANGIFGFVQDYKAEKSIESLKKMDSPLVKVLRGGKKKEIDSKELVQGDVIFLEQGNIIPADARIVESFNLQTDESALTGESLTVSKKDTVLEEDIPLAERKNMIYKNTNITRGHGKAIVTSTGMKTEVGKIAKDIQEAEEKETPFQNEVNELGEKIGIGILIIIAIVAFTEYLVGSSSIMDIALTAISLAVAAVPEGLPAIVTLSLALGSRKMVDKNALVRSLPVVESLGSVDVICTDKTGTLTEDKMTVEKIYHNGKVYKVTGEGYETEGDFLIDGDKVDSERLESLLKCGIYCNDSEKNEENFSGDPTEIAIMVSGIKAGLSKNELEKENPRVDEVSFTSERKMMSTLHEDGTIYTKGAPKVVLEKCTGILENGKIKKLTEGMRKEIIDKNKELASNALRVLGFAYKETELERLDKEDENELVFLGLQGMIDPPREEVKDAVKDCRDAGIKIVMITGDNAMTAQAIGEEIGFKSERAITGKELEEMGDKELEKALEGVEIFARVSPSHKVRILKALQRRDHIVAMTGDGVNDAPALKNSDVGVSMGVRGTDVAKQSSDMVLMDDNFKTIRDAVAEGRGIFDNIRKFVNYLLSANAAEVLVVFLAAVLGPFLFPGGEYLALTAVMLLWINLLTDGLPALALGADPISKDIMKHEPRPKSEGVINKRMIFSIISIGALMAVIILLLFANYLPDLEKAQTIAFTSLVIFELVRIQAVRSKYKIPASSNKWLWMAIAFSIFLQLAVLYTPLNVFFKVTPLGYGEWLNIFLGLLAFSIFTWFIVKIEDMIFE